MIQGSEIDWGKFGEKLQLALESSLSSHYERGTSGLELEFNILDEELQPVMSVGSGPERRSFADFLYGERLPGWVRDRFQLEVFNWMTEAATRPYYSARAVAAEARVLEAVLSNTLAELEPAFGERFFALHGNILCPLEPGAESIPGGWNLARTRYLTRCVEMYGRRLATAGIHTNHSFPEALLSWDFVHQPPGARRGQTLEDYRNHAVIRATRLLRLYCPLFIAVSAASPLSWESAGSGHRIVLSELDSQRLLSFPNPESLDVPGLYSSHRDYLRISYELVRSGARFGANNWTPVRARSDVEPVSRNILATSEQLRELYRKGVYSVGELGSLAEAERALTIENLVARVDLPMNRVEVRTDEGGDSFELAVAKVLFKELLMLCHYADPGCGADYRYDEGDLARARRNEDAAARRGLEAEIEDPHSGSKVGLRSFLRRSLDEVEPLAVVMGVVEQLEPLREMAGGGPNPAAAMREWMLDRIDGVPRRGASGAPVIPCELVQEWITARQRILASDVRRIADDRHLAGREADKLAPLVQGLRVAGVERPDLPVRLESTAVHAPISTCGGELGEVLELAAELVRIPSVTNCADERVEEVHRCARFIAGVLGAAGAELRVFENARYPAMVAGFPGALWTPVTLGGHFDVVPPDPGPEQFRPRIDGEYLWGRGAADMKTVVASYVVWMRRRLRRGAPYPPLNLMLVGNEENGEGEAWGTPQLLAEAARSADWQPRLMIFGERTGEQGSERFGNVCTANRGVVRLQLTAHGRRGHTGMGVVPRGVLDELEELKRSLKAVFNRQLTLASRDGWQSSVGFPFLKVGAPGVYNLTADTGVLGIELRPIPEDDVTTVMTAVRELAAGAGVELAVEVMEAGVRCPADNPLLVELLAAVEGVSGQPARVGRKLAGTSARFAPGGNAVVWGQSGLGPHSRDERHYIPSIEPYIAVLDAFADRLLGKGRDHTF